MLRGRAATVGVTLTCGMGWVLFGYDLGVLGGVLNLPNFQHQFPMSSTMVGLVTGIFELMAMVGAILMACFGSFLGRRDNMAIGVGLISLGAIIQSAAKNIGMLLGGRVIGGIGLGIFSSMCPVWQAETCRKEIRGRVVGVSQSFSIFGTLLAYWLDYGVSKYDSQFSWRFPFAFQIVLASINVIASRFMPESPRLLLLRGKTERARQTLAALRDLPDDDPVVNSELSEIEAAIELESNTKRGLSHLFKADDDVRSRRRMLTALALQFCQPFSGSAVISFYVATIFHDSVGLTTNLSGLMSGYLQIWFLFASVGTWWLIEHVGRRRMFLVCAASMSIVMFILGGLVSLNTHAAGIGAAAMIFLYEALFTWGWMAGVWLYSTEIQTLSFRTFGAALGAATQWLFNYVMLQVTPVAISNIGYKTYFIFACCNAAFVPLIWFVVPETAGIPLESLDLAFAPGVNPVKEAERIRSIIKQGRESEITLRHVAGQGKSNEGGEQLRLETLDQGGVVQGSGVEAMEVK